MSSITEHRGRGQPPFRGRGNPAPKTSTGDALAGGPRTGAQKPKSAKADSGQLHTNLQNPNNQALPDALISGRLKNFVPLPSDPSVLLTPEQLDALFPPENREPALREMVRLTRKRAGGVL
jgi:hypothetical protein